MKQILDSAAMQKVLSRMAHEIIEQCEKSEDLVLIGLQTRGVFLCRRIGKKISEIVGAEVPMGTLDISLYRDDLSLRSHPPMVKSTDITLHLDLKHVVLIDDVLFTGRSVRAAMDALNDFGRPRRIQLAILIDRGHRELPIRADFVGKNVPTAPSEYIQVRMQEEDGVDEVHLIRRDT